MSKLTQGWPVDGHVHFHDVAAVAPTLEAAARNFRAAGGRSPGLLGALLLTQSARERVFEALQGVERSGDWTIGSLPDEPETLLARHGERTIAIVCGRQVRAADGLEVLGLGTLQAFPDGLPFDEAVETVRRSGALTVVPWGFGKWNGARGRRVQSLLSRVGPREVLLGDNGSRLSWLGLPSLLRSSQRRGFRLLPGTDPFPFAGGHRRVGQFGFLADCRPSPAAPWRGLRAWLEACAESPPAYGEATGPIRFVFNQAGIQIYNRFLRSDAA
jgi:hypothetical protein